METGESETAVSISSDTAATEAEVHTEHSHAKTSTAEADEIDCHREESEDAATSAMETEQAGGRLSDCPAEPTSGINAPPRKANRWTPRAAQPEASAAAPPVGVELSPSDSPSSESESLAKCPTPPQAKARKAKVDADALLINSDALLLEWDDGKVPMVNDELLKGRGEVKAFRPPLDLTPFFYLGKGKEVEKVAADKTLLMRKVHIDIEDPIVDILVSCFKPDVGGNVYSIPLIEGHGKKLLACQAKGHFLPAA